MGATVRGAWLAVCVLWTAFWVGLYMISGPLTPEQHSNYRASLTIVLALPWLGGWLLYWIVNGSR
jgi:hypothetical protein